MSELPISENVEKVMDLIEELDLDETEHNQLVDLLIEKDPDFEDIFDRLVDEQSTRIPEFQNLRPQSKIMRKIKLISLMFNEYIDKGQDATRDLIHIQTASDEGLDLHGQDAGLERITLTKATGTVLVGSSIPPDSVYILPELFSVGTKGSEDQEALKFLGLDTPSIDPTTEPDEDGDYTVALNIIAENGGESYNLDPGMITEVYSKVPYFTLVKQKVKTDGGYDREDDDDYRERILIKKKSAVGSSIEWFKSEAESFDGVQEAIIIPCIHGEGTVGIVIRGTGSVVPQSLIDEIQARFDSDDIKPLANWRAFVSAIDTKTVDVTVTVYHLPGLTVLKSDVETKIEEYFQSLQIGESFVRVQMEAEISKVNNFHNLITISPIENNGVVTAEADELIVSNTISVDIQEAA